MRKDVGAFLGVVLLLSILPTVAHGQDGDTAALVPRITGLSSAPSEQGTEVQIAVQDGIANYQAYREEPTVLVVEIFGAQAEVNTGLLLGLFAGRTARQKSQAHRQK